MVPWDDFLLAGLPLGSLFDGTDEPSELGLYSFICKILKLNLLFYCHMKEKLIALA